MKLSFGFTPNSAGSQKLYAAGKFLGWYRENRMDEDPYDLQRFVEAQDRVIDRVHAELASGRKTSHWMWFVFPQIAGLGFSPMSQRFAIGSRVEAEAYLAHPVLGPRLKECVALVLQHSDKSAHAIFGSPDDTKLRSCLTLFDQVAPGDVFDQALATFFEAKRDEKTLALLRSAS
jgi:uncharacterized protein (DUF1810 family)